MKVFLSYHFRGDGDLAQAVERLLSSHDALPAKGRRLGGEQLTAEVRRLIENCDGLIALMTRREPLGDGDRWVTHPWVRDEYGHARATDKPAIALVEDGVEVEGAYAGHEWIPLDRESPLEAFLALSETLQRWRAQLGVHRIAQIRPDLIGNLFLTNSNNELRCRYRIIQDGVYGGWVEQEPVVAASGTLLHLRGVQDEDALVQVEILRGQQPQWWSQATAQFIGVDMLAPEEPQ